MKWISRWFKTKPSQPESANPSPVKPDEIDFGVDVPTDIRDMLNDVPVPGAERSNDLHESLKKAPMPDISGDEHVATVPDLKIIDPSSPDIDESTGFNPYDTAVLRKKWRCRVR